MDRLDIDVVLNAVSSIKLLLENNDEGQHTFAALSLLNFVDDSLSDLDLYFKKQEDNKGGQEEPSIN